VRTCSSNLTRRWSELAGLATLWEFCTIAAVSAALQAKSKNVYLDSSSRGLLSWWSVSVIPLWRAYELTIDAFGQSSPPYMGAGLGFFYDRLSALNALTKSELGTMLDEVWDEVVNVNSFTKDELVMKVLAYEGIWVDLAYGAV
jgi:hypothetical protein